MVRRHQRSLRQTLDRPWQVYALIGVLICVGAALIGVGIIEREVMVSLMGAGVIVLAPILVNRRTFAKELAKYSDLAGEAEDVCLQCAYSLEGLPGESDGCRVCPECGAA